MKKKNIAIMAMFMMSVLTLLVTVIIFEIKNYKEDISTQSVDSSNKVEDGKSEHESNIDTNNEMEDDNSNNDVLPIETTNDVINDTSKNEEEQKEINMIFAGDTYFSGYIIQKYNQNGLSGILSKRLQEEFKFADIAMLNEEFPFSDRGTPMKDKQYTFRIAPNYASIYKDMGVDLVTLANNHILDYGIDALLDTFTTLDLANINYVGAGRNADEAKKMSTYQVGDKTIAIVAASRVIPVTNWNATSTSPGLLTTYDPSILIDGIREAKKVSDFVIVYVHWGIEKNIKPKEYQRDLGKSYIDAGADIVIGSHPHVLQGIEYYNNKPIIYSLGNFMFYNSIEKTALLKIKIDKQDEIHISLLPCYAENAETKEMTNKKSILDFYSYVTSISYDVSIDEDGNVTEELE